MDVCQFNDYDKLLTFVRGKFNMLMDDLGEAYDSLSQDSILNL